MSGEWQVGSGEWEVGSGEWGVGSGEWGVGSGEWGVGSGEWEVGSETLPTNHFFAAGGSTGKPPCNRLISFQNIMPAGFWVASIMTSTRAEPLPFANEPITWARYTLPPALI